MNLLTQLQACFRPVLAELVGDPTELLAMIRPAQDPKFGDYQANVAMPLGKQLGQPPRDVAAQIVARIDVSEYCESPEIAGPGFINLRLKDEWLAARTNEMLRDERLGVVPVVSPRTFVIDYSSPNVAKPMHVGHIRSTVIGDAICQTLRFLGHRAISDNHLGDWGTQFGMIIYGYKHFVHAAVFDRAPVAELGRLYKFVNQLVDYHNAKQDLPRATEEAERLTAEIQQQESEPPSGDKAADKKARKALGRLKEKLTESRDKAQSLAAKIDAVESNSQLSAVAAQHAAIAEAVLDETAKLHAGDEENLQLWHQFLPFCRDEIQRIYSRLDITFDHEHGESFYHDMLAAVVTDLQRRGLATESEGAVCVFLDGFDAPMIVRKKDGAFLYATSDLATIKYRMETWNPDAILYVVDHRQSEHFEKLFAAVRLWGYDQVDLRHISFGTVLGNDGKPYRTRAGDTVGLEGLLDEAVQRALDVVSANDDAKKDGPELSAEEREHIARVVGHAAIKYADLSHNRTSDYKFDVDKMVAMEGNTATYMQYSYARTQSIFAKGGIDVAQLRGSAATIQLIEPA